MHLSTVYKNFYLFSSQCLFIYTVCTYVHCSVYRQPSTDTYFYIKYICFRLGVFFIHPYIYLSSVHTVYWQQSSAGTSFNCIYISVSIWFLQIVFLSIHLLYWNVWSILPAICWYINLYLFYFIVFFYLSICWYIFFYFLHKLIKNLFIYLHIYSIPPGTSPLLIHVSICFLLSVFLCIPSVHISTLYSLFFIRTTSHPGLFAQQCNCLVITVFREQEINSFC